MCKNTPTSSSLSLTLKMLSSQTTACQHELLEFTMYGDQNKTKDMMCICKVREIIMYHSVTADWKRHCIPCKHILAVIIYADGCDGRTVYCCTITGSLSISFEL